jgi:asparagine synthase (glutamine-hydrolysing)
MCGIAGFINLNMQPVEESKLNVMLDNMKHRGPDDKGVYIKNNIGFGFVRLSIIDLSASGHQPMFSPDGKFVVIFNGEIFNYIELRDELMVKGHVFQTNTDTEVLIKSYIEWGKECQHKFNGMWAFVIYNIEKDYIFISRDRFGIKPFYYYHDSNIFAFASEIPALLKVLPQKAQANEKVIFDYLVFNRTDHDEETFYKDVFKLQHGHSLSISKLNRAVQVDPPSQWYNLSVEVKKNKGKASLNTEKFRLLFYDSVKLRLRADVPIGVCFSGGLDSSTIVSTILNEFKSHEVKTFSAIYEKFQYGDESAYIKLYENVIKNMYYTTPTCSSLLDDLKKFIKIHAEPIPGTGPYAQYKVMELAKKYVSVTLDGQGADEMLGGYHYFFGYYFKDLLRRGRIIQLIQEIYYYILTHKSLYGLKTFVYFLLPASIKTSLMLNEKKYINKDFVKKYAITNSIAGNLYSAKSLNEALIKHFESKLEHLLKWEDLNSMAFSIEARVPFLDHNLVEAVLGLDGTHIIKYGFTKNLLRESMKGILPEEIRLRIDKIGFGTPQDEWFKSSEFQIIINEILDSSTFRNRNLINVDAAKLVYRNFLQGKNADSNEIWKFIHLELWFREFID